MAKEVLELGLSQRTMQTMLILSRIAVALVVLAVGSREISSAASSESTNQPRNLADLGDLFDLEPSQQVLLDIAEVNLLCAKGLSGAEDLDVSKCLATIDEWARIASRETQKNLYKFQLDPATYDNSGICFRMVLLNTLLKKYLGVSYNPAQISQPSIEDAQSTSFYRDSRDIFIHGLVTGKKQGTCASMPVLFIAIGRRMGYPLKLVPAAAHYFIRWEGLDGKERMNIEVAGEGIDFFPDEYYKKWPFPISDDVLKEGWFLKSLTPTEEVAEFLGLRGACLLENKRYIEAEIAFAHSRYLKPKSLINRTRADLENALLRERQEEGVPQK
jgi:hypothetical protein